ncbi:hypothetical protein GWI33_003440 [Rhynchophorus ferrugineus]|uniref:Transposable element P transposase n=1 Tax=Rhynchophorus ferrugineus TaxID=354439 RepID=A0A834IT86_RHYFE|nr:hypothetical protein GWI33_003440 [Rhynchophorus ferrugineus]
MQIYHRHRVCHRHFSEEFRVTLPSRTGIRANAYPTLFLSESQLIYKDVNGNNENINLNNLPSCSSAVNVISPNKEVLQEEQQSQCSIKETPRKARKSYGGIIRKFGSSRQTYLSDEVKDIYKKVVTSYKHITRNKRLVASFKSRFANISSSLRAELLKNLFEHVNKPTVDFFFSQLANQPKTPKSRRFTIQEKVFAIALLKSSGKTYKLLSKIFAFPSKSTCLALLRQIPMRAGLNEQIFLSLKSAVQNMSISGRSCIVMFDEMSLAPNLQYNIKEDCIDGLENTGSYKRAAIADYVNVFMVKGLFRKWKQPVSFTYSKGPIKSTLLKHLIVKVIGKCQEIGLKVLCTVCDQGSANQAAINSLLSQSRSCSEFQVNGEKIIPLYDIPHLFKGIRNNLLKKNLYIKLDNKLNIAKWEHIIDLYYIDRDAPMRICPRLTEQHVIPGKINKMKVKICTQVFSYTVASHLVTFSKWNNLPNDAERCLFG